MAEALRRVSRALRHRFRHLGQPALGAVRRNHGLVSGLARTTPGRHGAPDCLASQCSGTLLRRTRPHDESPKPQETPRAPVASLPGVRGWCLRGALIQRFPHARAGTVVRGADAHCLRRRHVSAPPSATCRSRSFVHARTAVPDRRAGKPSSYVSGTCIPTIRAWRASLPKSKRHSQASRRLAPEIRDVPERTGGILRGRTVRRCARRLADYFDAEMLARIRASCWA